MVPCSRCGRPSVIHQRYSGLNLCAEHFEEDVQRKIRETLRTYRIFSRGGRVAVALSGGKDSSVLLYTLKRIFSHRRDIELIALMVDEGISGYREDTLQNAAALADRLDVPHITLSFREEFGITIDEIAERDLHQAPCTYCGVMRKHLLNKRARELNAIALATGHNLDDEAQTILLNYLRGDVDRLFRLLPKRPKEGLVYRIKPLRRIPEREVAIYAMIHGIFPRGHGSCPNVPRAMRLEVKNILNEIEARHPGTKYSILRGFDKIRELAPDIHVDLHRCERCGEPAGGSVCKTCQLLEGFRAKPLSHKSKNSCPDVRLGSSAGQSE
ncbi:MAG: TIGR00269 family protein [Methanothrix sp.]|uniref:PP-loop domain protein n=1 Tax=Methanothrix thermoacetophila (strain DSM 6194 / JCM 14653 / NBRC 101360 / PT) TaxID=349307 RepID=A0B6P2_METTP|nr:MULTISPECIES: TIGR00269 family protein [Methanothrix]ABK14366.1 PP-loop domain protein [Methanothrix thermoacetophila PT]MBC7079639.1 TIGR00269 family protein [Methanothrix sp.]NPU87608.1 TIGR00269 family protein [Methanothrix sp.]